MLSPLLFNCVMDGILREATEMLGGSERPGEMASCCMPAQTCHCVVTLFLDPVQRP